MEIFLKIVRMKATFPMQGIRPHVRDVLLNSMGNGSATERAVPLINRAGITAEEIVHEDSKLHKYHKSTSGENEKYILRNL